MREGETISAARKRRTEDAETPTIAWRVLLPMSGGFFFITAILLWLGAVVAVRCERVGDGRVDVTVEHRLLGLVTARTEHLVDVVQATSFQQTDIRRRAGTAAVQPQIRLTLRDGREWESTPAAMHIVGTGPTDMATRIQGFIERPSDGPLEMRWIPG